MNLFSTYSTGENRVTASILAVLGSLALSRTERLIGELLEDRDFRLVVFTNQPSRGGEGVPDALILASARVYIETKMVANAVRSEQISRHLTRLDEAKESHARLLVLTPDSERPAAVSQLSDPRLAWSSFAALEQAIDGLLDDRTEVISEREAFLLRELQAMLQTEHLVTPAKDVLVIAARTAWPEYERFGVYACQASRRFQAASRLAFYCDGEIKPLVPRILKSFDDVDLANPPPEIAEVAARLLAETERIADERYKVMLLSSSNDAETVAIEQPVVNDLQSESGRTIAYTQGHRYSASTRLRNAQRTSQLD